MQSQTVGHLIMIFKLRPENGNSRSTKTHSTFTSISRVLHLSSRMESKMMTAPASLEPCPFEIWNRKIVGILENASSNNPGGQDKLCLRPKELFVSRPTVGAKDFMVGTNTNCTRPPSGIPNVTVRAWTHLIYRHLLQLALQLKAIRTTRGLTRIRFSCAHHCLK